MFVVESLNKMARGHQKAQSQASSLAKTAAQKSKQGHSANDQNKSDMKALNHQCPVCRSLIPDAKTFKQHFENKHPSHTLPRVSIYIYLQHIRYQNFIGHHHRFSCEPPLDVPTSFSCRGLRLSVTVEEGR